MSNNNAGDIQLGLKIDSKGFNKQMAGMQKLANKAAVALAAAFSVKALATFGKQCLELGSDLAEVQNVVDTVFPNMSETVNKFAQNAAATYGLSETMAKRYAGTFGAMADAFGFAESESYDMATALTGLAGDVASFYNITQDEAYTKLKSVFTGETESLKDLGVVMTQTALDQYALANGFGRTTAAMTEQEKVALRYAFVQDQLSNAAGDFAKTSGSWANQVRYLTLQMESFKAAIGQGLINILTPVIKWINLLMSKLVGAANAFKRFTETLTGKKSEPITMKSTNDSVESVATSANNATNAVKNTTKKVKALKRELAGFDQITKLNADTSDSGASNPISSGGPASGISTTPTVAPTTEAPGDVEKLTDKYKNLGKAIDKLKTSFKAFTDLMVSAGKWVYDNVLVPLGKWTMNKLLPKIIELLAAAFDVLTAVLEALAPIFKTVWDTFLEPIAKFTGKVIIAFLEVFTKLLNKLADTINEHPKLFRGLVTALLGLIAVKKVGGWFTNGLGAIKSYRKGISSLETVVSAFSPKLGKVFGNIKGKAGSLMKVFGKFGKFLAPPGGLIIAGLLAVVAAGILVYKNWDKIKKFAKKVGDAISKAFKPIADFFKKTWKSAIEKGTEIIEDMKKRVEGVVDGLKTYFGGWLDFITGIFTGDWEKAWDGIKGIFEGYWDTITSALNLPKIDVVAKLSAIKDAAFDKASDAWHAIKNKTSELVANAKEKVAGVLDSIKGKWGDIKTKAAELTANAKEKVAGALDSIKSGWNTVKTKTASLTATAINKASGVMSTLKSAWSSIKTKAATLTGKAVNKNSSTLSKLQSAWSSFKSKTVELTAKFKDVFTAPLKAVWNAIADKINSAITTINKIPGVNIKGKVPKLAQGGYVKKNTPQLAMIGDNRHQGEVVAPERKLEEMALKAASMAGGGVTPELIAILKEILGVLNALDLNVYLDGKQVKKRIVELINANTKATGVCEIIV